jgi:hypothetical protein
MSKTTRYLLNPQIAWVNEGEGRIRLILPGCKQNAWLEGVESLLWRSLWLGFDTEMWLAVLAEEGRTLKMVMDEWLKAGWIMVAD